MSNHSHTFVTASNTSLTPQLEREIYDAASSRLRRFVLAVARERNRPVGPEELATRLAARRRGKPLRRVTDEEHRDALAALHHTHLPKLEEVGLVRRDSDGRVTATDGSLVRRAGLDGTLENVHDRREEDLDELFDLLSEPVRGTLLAVLDDVAREDFPLDVEAVADAVLERSGPGREPGPTDDARERLVVSLHHRHLPKLADAGVLAYDREERTVTFEGYPPLRDVWT